MAKQKNLTTTEVTTEETTEVLNVIPNNQLPLTKRTYNSKALTEAVHAIGEATIKGNMERWKIAKACYNIASDNLWNKDFKSQKDFADSIGYANSTITGFKNAVAFTLMHENMIETDEDGNVISGITVDKADILCRLEDYEAFNAYCIDHEHKEAYTIGDNKLKKLVSEYKKSLIEDKKTEETTEETQETPNVVVNNTEEKTTELTIFDKNGYKMVYENIPLSIANKAIELLNEYEVARYDLEGNKIG
jgi:hypothetical protein